MMKPNNLSKCIVSSSRLASIFDWRMNSRIMAIDVSKRLISLSVAEHPNLNQDDEYDGRNNSMNGHRISRTIERIEPIVYMDSIHTGSWGHQHCNNHKNYSKAMFNSRKEHVKKQINDMVEDLNVVGFVVGWPLEPSGLPGANCGRVLHLLDFLVDDKNGSVIRKNRPLTLWDQRVMTHNNQFTELQNAQDKWGRSAAFCSKPKKSNGERGAEDQEEETFYISNHSGDNQSQWGNTSNSNNSNTSSISAGGECAERLLKQFLDSHYKLDANDERYSRQRQRKNVPTTSSSSSYNFLHIIQQYERNGACIASSLL